MQRTNSKAIEKMNGKKAGATSKRWEGRRIVDFVGDVKQELKRVDWTSRDELKLYTKVVLASTFLMGFLVYFTDLIIRSCLDGVTLIVRAIFG